MYKIYFNRVDHSYELREMVRMFLPSSEFVILEEDPRTDQDASEASSNDILCIPDEIMDKNAGKRFLYNRLAEATGNQPEWGILTGVRPVKLFGDLIRGGKSPDEAKAEMMDGYLLGQSKANLLLETWKTQQKTRMVVDENRVALYVGIPFCPSRCLYCSFPSYQATPERMKTYLTALWHEMDVIGREMKSSGLQIESIYVGGGTPTTLSPDEMQELLIRLLSGFPVDHLREFTVEAGRPDTITPERLNVLKSLGVGRISINPQTMKQSTLDAIGRAHTPAAILEAFQLAKEIGFSVINADLIAGLPGETIEDFVENLEAMIQLGPENLTVHTLAVKRASRLAEVDLLYNYHQGEQVGEMLKAGADLLMKAEYHPYYLYRQKQMTGNHENVGYALQGTESIYNIRIMEENQTVVALGAGGISKQWYPSENRLERIPNVSNFEQYTERIDEMIQRKLDHMFHIGGGCANVKGIKTDAYMR